MIFYDKENEKNSHGVFNDEGYLVMHFGYRDAMKEFRELIILYDLIRTYLDRMSYEEDGKHFIPEEDAQGIKQMMDVYKKRQEVAFNLFSMEN